MADLGHDPVSGAPVSGLDSPAAPAPDQIVDWFDDPCVLEDIIEDPAPYDFVAATPLPDDVIIADQPAFPVLEYDDPEEDWSPLDWFQATAPPAEYDVPAPAIADDTADGTEDDPAPLDYVSSLAALEHDVPPASWPEDTDDGSADDVAPWDYVATLATDEHDLFAPLLPEITDDGSDDDPAPFDWFAGQATEEIPPEEMPAPSWADDTADGSEDDPAPFDWVNTLATDEIVIEETPIAPTWADDPDDGSIDDIAAYDFSFGGIGEDAPVTPEPSQLAVTGGYPGSLKKRKKPRDEVVADVAMVVAADAPEIADPRALAVKIVGRRPQRFQVIDDRALALIRAELIEIQREIARIRQENDDDEDDLEILLLGG